VNLDGRLVFVGVTIKGNIYYPNDINGELNEINGQYNREIATAWVNNTNGFIEKANMTGVHKNDMVQGQVDIRSLADTAGYYTRPTDEFTIQVCDGTNCFYPLIWTKPVEYMTPEELWFQSK